MKITLEQTAHLPADEAAIARCMASFSGTLDEFYVQACAALGQSWFVYRGGSHVAIHRTSGDDRRVIIATA